jgi:hypothetical protein
VGPRKACDYTVLCNAPRPPGKARAVAFIYSDPRSWRSHRHVTNRTTGGTGSCPRPGQGQSTTTGARGERERARTFSLRHTRCTGGWCWASEHGRAVYGAPVREQGSQSQPTFTPNNIVSFPCRPPDATHTSSSLPLVPSPPPPPRFVSGRFAVLALGLSLFLVLSPLQAIKTVVGSIPPHPIPSPLDSPSHHPRVSSCRHRL